MALDGRGPATAMAVPICEGLGVAPSEGAALAAEIVKATYGRPPAQLGQLAPAVVAAADAGDEVASRTVDTAADHLTALAIAVAGAEDPATIVLAGSLLTKAVTISRTVSTRLGARWPSANVAIASSGEAGAAALAISARAATSVDDTVLDRLLGGARQQ